MGGEAPAGLRLGRARSGVRGVAYWTVRGRPSKGSLLKVSMAWVAAVVVAKFM